MFKMLNDHTSNVFVVLPNMWALTGKALSWHNLKVYESQVAIFFVFDYM